MGSHPSEYGPEGVDNSVSLYLTVDHWLLGLHHWPYVGLVVFFIYEI